MRRFSWFVAVCVVALYSACGGGGGGGENGSPVNAPTTLPAAPYGLTVEAVTGTMVRVAWEPGSSEIAGYSILRNTEPTGYDWEVSSLSSNFIRSHGTVHFDTFQVDPDTTYYYRVRAFKEYGTADPPDRVYSIPSEYVSVTTPGAATAVPAAPTGLGYTQNDSWIDFTWNDNAGGSNGEEYFQIWYKLVSGYMPTWSPYLYIDANSTSWSWDQGPGTVAYRVQAINTLGVSSFSNSVTVTVGAAWSAAAPSQVTATPLSSSSISLSWTDNTPDEDGFVVERSLSADSGFSRAGSVAADTTLLVDTGLTSATTYHYRVKAVKGTRSSPASETVSGTTWTAVSLAPTAPENVSAAATGPAGIAVSWTDSSDNEDSFIIYRSTTLGENYTPAAVTDANVTSYNDTGLVHSTTYYYYVTAVNAAGESLLSNVDSDTTDTLPVPAAPTGLAATPLSPTSMVLTWTDNASNESGFKIYRSTVSGSGYGQVGSMGPGATSWRDAGLTAQTTYYYRVTAFNGDGESGYVQASNTTQAASAAPAAPSGLSAAALSSTGIALSWADNSADEDGFKVERGTFATGPFNQVATVTAASYSDSGLSAGTTYYYRVRAYNGSGNSDYCPVASATTQVASQGILRLVNHTKYAMVDIRFNNVQQVSAGTYLPPGDYYDFNLSPGTYSLGIGVGMSYQSGSEVWFQFAGQATVSAGATMTVNINNPSIGQLLTGFAPNRDYIGEYWDQNNIIQWRRYRFTSGNGWTRYELTGPNSWTATGSGTVSEVLWNDYAQIVTFRLCPTCADINISYPFGSFFYQDGPPSWSRIYYMGQ